MDRIEGIVLPGGASQLNRSDDHFCNNRTSFDPCVLFEQVCSFILVEQVCSFSLFMCEKGLMHSDPSVC